MFLSECANVCADDVDLTRVISRRCLSGLSTVLLEILTNGRVLLTMIRGPGKSLVGMLCSLITFGCVVNFSYRASCTRYFRKFERYTPDTSFPLVDEKVKGSDGPVQVGYFNYISEASKQFIKACMNIGIPYSPDFNTSAGTRGVNRVS